MKLLFEQAAFSEPILFKDSCFFKAVILFARAAFSEDDVSLKN